MMDGGLELVIVVREHIFLTLYKKKLEMMIINISDLGCGAFNVTFHSSLWMWMEYIRLFALFYCHIWYVQLFIKLTSREIAVKTV